MWCTFTPGTSSTTGGRSGSMARVNTSTATLRSAMRRATSTTYTLRPPAAPVPGCSSGEVGRLTVAIRDGSSARPPRRTLPATGGSLPNRAINRCGQQRRRYTVFPSWWSEGPCLDNRGGQGVLDHPEAGGPTAVGTALFQVWKRSPPEEWAMTNVMTCSWSSRRGSVPPHGGQGHSGHSDGAGGRRDRDANTPNPRRAGELGRNPVTGGAVALWPSRPRVYLCRRR